MKHYLVHDRVLKFEEFYKIMDDSYRRLLVLVKDILAMSYPKGTNTRIDHVKTILIHKETIYKGRE